MDYPRLIVALADDRHRQCPCGAVAERPDRLCGKCHARMLWRRKTTRTSRRAVRRLGRMVLRRHAMWAWHLRHNRSGRSASAPHGHRRCRS